MKRIACAVVLLATGAGPIAWAQEQQHQHGQAEAEPVPSVQQHEHALVEGAALVEPAVAPVPRVTAADRAAAVAASGGHPTHDGALHGLLIVDRLESWQAGSQLALGWKADAWIGTDLQRIWLRGEGARRDGHNVDATVEVLAGRSVSRWWDLLAGVRHDFGIAEQRDYLAIGIQGLAPYWIEIAATVYAGRHARSAARFEVEHDLLFTNRLVLQSRLQADLFGKDDAANAFAAGLSSMEAGLRLRYEFTRRFAPYVGLNHERALSDAADLRQELGRPVRETHFVLGVRTWF